MFFNCTNNNESKEIDFSTHIEDNCVIDSTINNTLIINNVESIKYNGIDENNLYAYDDWIYLSSQTEKEYIGLQKNYGGDIGEFKMFEVGKIQSNTFVPESVIEFLLLNPKENDFSFVKTRFDEFHTESGIELGLTRAEVVSIFSIKSIDLIEVGDNMLYYLNEDCMYEYSFYFESNHLTRYRFGFTTP